ncbi:MAG: tetratricopeptide repeat protein [Elusimicrobium sp.]|jgi:tetratricopeptide (TPR) repeat protein|nr:tetratricopeptide repeat protein [Elusimicrobium sp.]
MRNKVVLIILIYFISAACAQGAAWPFAKKGKIKLTEARELYAKHDYDGAIVKLKDFLVEGTVKRREKRAYLLMGDCYEKLGRLDSALNTYVEGVELNPKNKELLTRLAALYERTDLTQNSIETYRRILELDDEDADAVLGLARGYAEEGFFSKAQQYYKMFFDLKPKNIKSYFYEYALVYYKQRNYNAALFHIGLSLEAYKNQYKNNFLAAQISRDMGNKENAAKFLDAALAAENNYEAVMTKALWAVQDGDYASALKIADGALAEDPADRLALYIRYMVFARQGKNKEARKYLEKITAQDNDGFIRRVALVNLNANI